jgi:hypothetical protein
MRLISNEVIGIGIPCNFPWVPLSFFNSFALMEKPSFQFITADNGPIDTLRNDIVQKALDVGVTRLIMMDVDQVYPGDTVVKLLKHKLPFVGVSVNRRYPPFDPIMMKLTDAGYEPISDYERGDLIEVDATGAGCVMYDMAIFKELPYPWFRFQKDPKTGATIGEDIGLCQDLKARGYRLFVDTAIEVGHLTTMIVNNATHDLYTAMKCAKERKEKALKVIND